MKAKKILVVDDEKDIAELIAFNLEQEGFSVFRAGGGEEAMSLIRSKEPDLVILDLMMPGLSGFDVCRLVRKNVATENLPIIMVTARGENLDKVLGLELGADDYITKPFSVRELVARVRAVLRRSERRPPPEGTEFFSCRDLEINYLSYEVRRKGQKIDLGTKELKLLIFLTKNPGRVYSRDQLLEYVWGDETFVEPRTVDVHISRLRAAIEEDRDHPEFILTVRGLGYKFVDLQTR
ncbi:MAG: response regulator transcription factor [Syntrophobacterales bacterium]|nr:response regulator transcription factor [Syntrophobacterales bacterium]